MAFLSKNGLEYLWQHITAKLQAHVCNDNIHVNNNDKTKWNEAESNLTSHINDDDIHLPSYTSEDEGKFLRIVDGVPVWVSIE